MRKFQRVLVAVLTAVSMSAALAGTELYGKPLRGLSAVPIADVAKSPDAYRGRAIRVAGKVSSSTKDAATLSADGASVRVETDGTFSLPGGLEGAALAAEGKLKGGEAVLVATGVEVSR